MVVRLPVAYEMAARPELWGKPVVVAHPEANVVWSASVAALAEGVREGQRLSEAVGRCPSLAVFDPRLARYEAVDAAMLDAVEKVVPGVEPGGMGAAFVDLSGAVRSHGSAEQLHQALLACAPSALRPRLGVAPTKFVARLAASQVWFGSANRTGGGAMVERGGRRIRAVGADEVKGFLAPLPVEALPVPVEVVRCLRLVGVTTIGELSRLRRSALIAQFGHDGARLADLLAGADEPVRPRPHLEVLRGRLVLPEPLVSRGAVVAAADHVLKHLLRRPQRRDRVARQVVVRTETERGRLWEATVTLREPRGDHDGIRVALTPVLERATLPGPVSELSIELRGLRAAQGWQRELWPTQPGGQPRRERVEEALQQLRARYDDHSLVGRMTAVEPADRVPERRWALVES
jgi:nucleotidyltransferase/DNA polymerase involved in DNA repair